MFKRTFLTLVLAVTFIFGSAEAARYRKYPDKSGKIVYEVTGTSTGIRTVYWDDYGYREISVDDLETKLFGMKKKGVKTTLILGPDQYTWDDGDNRVFKAQNPVAEKYEREDYNYDEVAAYDKALLEGLGFEIVGTDSDMGKPCDIWSGLGSKVWVWKNHNVSLKSEMNIMGIKVNILATVFDANCSVPGSVFNIPAGREIIEPGQDSAEDEGPSDEAEMAGQFMKGLIKNLSGE